jgi:inner membrane protein
VDADEDAKRLRSPIRRTELAANREPGAAHRHPFLGRESAIRLGNPFHKRRTSLMTSWLIWFLLGVGLALLEMLTPGLIIIFFAAGALITAGLTLMLDLTLTLQLLIFLTLSLLSLLLLRSRLSRTFRGAKLANGADSYDDFPSGAKAQVVKTITATEHGRIHYRGTEWYATADQPIAVGTTVEILSYADASRQIFRVRAAEPSN